MFSDIGEIDEMKDEVSTGTTILAFTYADGVMIAADSRTSMGSYIANRVTDKLTKITDYVYCCRSGSAADTQAIADIVSYNVNLYENQHNKHVSVHNVALEFRSICYNYRDQLLAGIIVAGYDMEEKKGKVYSIPLGGMFWEEEVAIGGSGSAYVQGYIDAKYTPNMDISQAINFACSVIGQASMFDGSSGGVIRMASIGEVGVNRYTFVQTLKREGTPGGSNQQTKPGVYKQIQMLK